MARFERQVKVRFAHCDPAAIVFYPRYFEMINGVVEDWFDEQLLSPFRAMLQTRGVVVPTVHFTVDFDRASELGDILIFALEVTSVGRTSVTLRLEARCGTEVRLTAKQVLVFADQGSRRPIPIPTDIVEKIRSMLGHGDSLSP